MRRASILGLSVAAAAWLSPAPASATSEPDPRPLRSVPQASSAAPQATTAAPIRSRPNQTIERKPEKVARFDKLTVPQGQLLIVVSIDKQRLTLYADGKPVTSTAVSTGTPDHPTPMGVFSVIQKRRHHVSNLYGSSMPFMQRLTWSGVAMHQGPLPGRPASHGCVRLPNDFAEFLWRTTKIGARVVITRDDVAPTEIALPGLFVRKPKSDAAWAPLRTLVKVADATGGVTRYVTTDAPIVLAQAIERPAAAPLAVTTGTRSGEQATKLLGDPQPRSSDAKTEPKLTAPVQAAEPAPAPADVAKAADAAITAVGTVAGSIVLGPSRPLTPEPARNSAGLEQATKVLGERETASASVTRTAPAPAAPAPVVAAPAPVLAAPAPVVAAPAPVAAAPAPKAPQRIAEPSVPMIEPAPLNLEFAKPVERPTAPPVQQAAAPAPTSTPVQQVQQPTPAPIVAAAPAQPALQAVPLPPVKPFSGETTAIAAPAPIMRELGEPAPAVPTIRDIKRSNDPVTVFVSRRDGKLYVRQKMTPLFDTPIGIKHPDQPIGTHVYTAMSIDDTIRWTVVSLPSSTKPVLEAGRTKVADNSKKSARDLRPVMAKAEPLPDARAAIARLDIPADTAEKIAELLVPGSSLIISDNKISGETGEYTDFIILTP